MKVLITEEQLKLIVSHTKIDVGDELINEVNLKSIGNKVKTLLNKISMKKGKKDVSSLKQSDLSAALPSTSLKKYLNQLKSIISPLYSLAIEGKQEQSAACRAHAKEIGVLKLMKGSTDLKNKDGFFAGDKYHAEKIKSSVDAINTLMVRMRVDMEQDLKKSNMLEKDFTVDDAIEMLYFKYGNEKSVLQSIARGIMKIAGGFVIDGRIWRVLQKQIADKYGEKSGSLLNSVMSDFIGGLAGITDDYGAKACAAYISGIREQITYYSQQFGDQGAPNGGYDKFWGDGDIDWNLEVDCFQSCEVSSTTRNRLSDGQIQDRKRNLGKVAKRKYSLYEN